MPFSLGFQSYPWLDRALRVRQHPVLAYGLALILVALAVFGRKLVGEYAGVQVFTTFYPAIIIAALVGGLWPGVLATVLSTVAAWYFLVPQFFSLTFGRHEVVELLLFVFISGIDVAVAVLLNEIVERLVLQQRNIRVLLEAAPNGFVLVDDQGTIKLVNASTEKLFGYDRAELTGKRVELLVPERHANDHRHLRGAYQEEPEVRAMGLGRDLSGRRKDGSEFPVEIGLNPVGRDGKPAVLATVMDISARKQAEEHQHLLIGELEHRTRNVFNVVLAVIDGGLREATTIPEARQVLGARVKALLQAYTLQTDTSWKGASLARIIHQQIVAHANRIAVDLQDVVVTPRAVQQFAMIIHELTTNALKHGALSVAEGRILISGRLAEDAESFVLSWKETGGPRVAPPTRKGFGSMILVDAAQQFGHVVQNFPPEGMTYELRVNLDEIEASRRPPTQPRTSVS
jgi:PAS domain S-box-containing protein